MNSAVERLVGFDAAAEVLLHQGRVYRGIYRGWGEHYRAILRSCETHNLFRFGIVATRELPENPFPHLPYEAVFEHERIPFVSYPHEWPAPMLKAAALFHIDLFNSLAPYGLTVKDWHPYNILFSDTRPVFVDFASIIPMGDQRSEAYLSPRYLPAWLPLLRDAPAVRFYEMYRRMCVPYFLLPLYLMHLRRHARARQRMLQTALNAAESTIGAGEVFSIISLRRLGYEARELLKGLALVEPGTRKTWFLWLLRLELRSLRVAPRSSGYSGYYAAKGHASEFEPSSAWTAKQRVVYETLRTHRPRTVLDLGSNIGWYSILAAKQGCRVVAVDVDEASLTLLHERAVRECLPILPLWLDVGAPTPDIMPLACYAEQHRARPGAETPLLLAAERRLKCELVLALAIVHHLALGKGLAFEEIVSMLSRFTEKRLLVEFVDSDDPLIQAEPAFFKAYHESPRAFGWYSREGFLRALACCFADIDVRQSESASRVIVDCSR